MWSCSSVNCWPAMTRPEDPQRIEFPCEYPISVIARSHDNLFEDVFAVLVRHAPELTLDAFDVKPSRNGRYASVRVRLVATGEPQLKRIHADLMRLESVKMVL